jgi:hypothetical protein
LSPRCLPAFNILNPPSNLDLPHSSVAASMASSDAIETVSSFVLNAPPGEV